ncbi:MAG: outer membrane lipoprotein carrier protein LolA [Acidobacteria bacterium]|nr:outer membrane lipoprotein carrier protein LolA [Acidobacteriota bacterium]
MKRNYLILMMMTALVVVSLLAIPKTQANGDTDQILKNMQSAARNIKTLSANLSQDKKLSIGGHERYNGTVIIQRGTQGSEKAIVHYTNGQHVSVVGNLITLYNERTKQAIITTRQKQANDKPEFNFIATPFRSTAELKQQFDINHVGDEDGMAKLELTPKNPRLQKSTIWVDRGNWLPTRFKVMEKTGDVSVFTLSNLQPNVSVNASTFKINWPSDTAIIKK